MEEQVLRPTREELILNGKMSYNESNRAWTTIRFKKEILNEFKQLKERMSKFAYNLLFYSEWNEFEKSMRKIRKEGLPPPVMIWFVKEKPIN